MKEPIFTGETKILPKNLNLVKNFVKGNLSGNTNSLNGSGYTFSVENGILAFPDFESLYNFQEATENLVAQWETQLDYVLTGIPEDKNHAGEPALNVLGPLIGFNSLRRVYVKKFYEDSSFMNKAETFVEDRLEQTTLNEYHEIKIGDTIYKYISRNVVAKIANNDLLALNFLRNNPNSAIGSENVIYSDPITNEPIQPQSITLGACTIFLVVNSSQSNTGGYKTQTITVIPIMYNPPNANPMCFYLFDYVWGDGFSEYNQLSASMIHTYNVTLSPGQCQNFTATVTVHNSSCSPNACNGMSESRQVNVNVCNPVQGCGKRTTEHLAVSPNIFMIPLKPLKIEGRVGAVHAGFLRTRRIYAESYLYYFDNNRWYPARSPGLGIVAHLHGYYFVSNCVTSIELSDGAGGFNRSSVVKSVFPRQEFSRTPYLSSGILANHELHTAQNTPYYRMLDHLLP